LPAGIKQQVRVIDVGLAWREPSRIDRLLETMIAAGTLAEPGA